MQKNITIIKASGAKVPFSEEKYRLSLHNSGSSEDQINTILKELEPKLYDGISTQDIYNMTHDLMRNKRMFFSGGRYHLRQAILDLGPTGFPFERFVARLMEAQGFKTLVDQTISGKCIPHEIDIIATKGDMQLFVECKFHNWPGDRCDVQTTLYVKARHDDIISDIKHPGYDQCYLITNTKFSHDSIDYGRCIGMYLLGWAYPHNNGLEKIIDNLGLHPITCLSTIPKKILHDLAQQGIIFCQELIQNSSQLDHLGLAKKESTEILQQCDGICSKK